MKFAGLAGVCLFALAACSSSETFDSGAEDAEDSAVTDGESNAKTLAEASEDRAKAEADKTANAKSENFKDEESKGAASREFTYIWPKQVSAIPALAKSLGEERDKALTAQKKEWNEAVAENGSDECVSCVTRETSVEWKVVADLPRFLSLSAGSYIYGGGAHGNSFTASMIWDRKAEASLEASQMFISEGVLWRVASGAYCEALDKQREKKRGRPVAPDDFGSDCPDLDDLTLMLGSSDGKSFDRIGLIADPYVAGPYAEGDYEVTLPLTEAMKEAVKPEYREYFSAK